MNPLEQFLPAVRHWFEWHYSRPTPPQALGWPAIQRGEHTLILSPTGSGKTLAAFLWGIDSICRELIANPGMQGVQLLYISPLKALNNDVERNLRAPLAGILKAAHEMGHDLPPVRAMVRTGDTPQSTRRRMVTQPPHILITTPESLYLLLISPRASEMLRSVRTVIVDEIHTLCGNKRGVHLGLSLERLSAVVQAPFQRIGLSATQRPLDEVARYLGGLEWQTGDDGEDRLVERPVTIVDAGAAKELDLRVVTTVPDLRRMPGGSIWPSLIPQLLEEVRRHRTTLIFTNSRRAAERAADRLNEQYAQEEDEEIPPGSPEGLLVDGVPKGQGMFGTGRIGGPFRAHHGSVSKEVRLELEHRLKAGELPALIGTSSLELGIDIGSIDLVAQIQSPRSVSRGLQRVGRSGHLVGETSVGIIYASHREDLLDCAAVAHGMLQADIEPVSTPQNCLDVLAQQIVAMTAMQDWDTEAAYRLVKQAYGYQKLTHEAFEAVLAMLSGKYPSEVFRELRARIQWDRVRGRLSALPGSRLLATYNGGTISDRGELRVYMADGKTVLGTLDEEFAFETRPGDVFTLGSSTWRALSIKEDRVVVAEASGGMPRMPFWRGDAPRRDYYSGVRLGAFRRELAEWVRGLPHLPDHPIGQWPTETQPLVCWLQDEYRLDEASARNAILYARNQLAAVGAMSSDRTVLVETFSDPLGDRRMVIHSCFGGMVNSAWALALAHALRERLGVPLEVQANDDGILFRLVDAERELPTDILAAMGPDEARDRLLQELPESAVFGAHFRMNAARALLLPGVRGAGRRTPFWLQRLRAKDLLAVAKHYPDFPLLAETFRDCLRDVLDMEHLVEVLRGIEDGRIRLVEAVSLVPSPVAASLLSDMMAVQIYEGDLPKAERQAHALAVNRELLEQLLDEGALPDLLRPEAIRAVEWELQHLELGYKARTREELALIVHELGDLTHVEAMARAAGDGEQWLLQLAAEGRLIRVPFACADGEELRWIFAEDYGRYRDALSLPDQPPVSVPDELLACREDPEQAWERLLHVYAAGRGPFSRQQVLTRYASLAPWLDALLDSLTARGRLVKGRLSPGAQEIEWCDRRVLERIHRRTLSLLRKEIRPAEPPAYVDFLARWQGLHPRHQRKGVEGLTVALQQLRGLWAPAAVWERDLLRTRVADYVAGERHRGGSLDALCADGDLVWAMRGADDPRRAQLSFVFRGEGALFWGGEPAQEALSALSERAAEVYEILLQEGALHTQDIGQQLGLRGRELDAALVELLMSSLITNDHLNAVRSLYEGAVDLPKPGGGVRSALEQDLRDRRTARSAPSTIRRPRPSELRRAREVALQRTGPFTHWTGRWSLVHRAGGLGRDLGDSERVQARARLLLQRYGIVTREVVDREQGGTDWARLYDQFESMEIRGEVRRGYFVRGFSGAQFALPEAVERLREWSRPESQGADELVLMSASDPANLYGSANSPVANVNSEATEEGNDLTQFARLPGNYLVLQRGMPVLLYEHGSEHWKTAPYAAEGVVRRAVQRLLGHLTQDGGLCSRPRRVRVLCWNGECPLGSSAQWLLEGLEFRRDPPAMVWDGLGR